MIIINNNYYSHIWFDRIILNKVAALVPLLLDLEDNYGLMVVLGWVRHHLSDRSKVLTQARPGLSIIWTGREVLQHFP